MIFNIFFTSPTFNIFFTCPKLRLLTSPLFAEVEALLNQPMPRDNDDPKANEKDRWAANKRLETSKFKFKFPRARNIEIIGLVLGCIEAKFCK